MEVPEPKLRWVATVRLMDNGELFCFDLTDNGNPAGTNTGFRTKGAANYAARRMVKRMNAANLYN